ncbi:MAG: PAS domain-containing protein [Roseomonas mucosa]|nr:PAS domain-containing protein [Roseomonas mucosa]
MKPLLRLLAGRTLSHTQRYGGAALVVLAVAAFRALLPISSLPFLFFIPALMVVAFAFRRGPGFFATALSALIADYLFVEPIFSLALAPEDWLSTGLFAAVGLSTVAVSDALAAGLIRRDADVAALAAGREALAESEAFLRSVLGSSADCIKVLDLDARLTFMSEGGQRVMEVGDFNAIRGCPWPDFWRGQGNADARAAVEAARAGGRGHFRGAAETMAGNPRYWDVQVTPIFGADGKPEKLLSVSRDITATRTAEEALRDREAYWRGLFERLQEGIILGELVRDAEGRATDWRYLDVNPAWGELVGFVPEKVIGVTLRELIPGVEEAWVSEVVGAVETGTPTFFTRQVGALGRWYEGRIFPLEGDRFAILFQNITARREADAEVRRLATLVEQSTDFIGVAATDGSVLFVNPAGCRLVGLSDLGQARTSTITDYFMPEDRAALTSVVLPAVRQHGYWEGELRFRHFGTGQPVPVLYNIFPVRDAAGEVTAYGTVTRDLRELRKAGLRRDALIELDDHLRDMEDADEMAFKAAEVIGRALDADRTGYGTLSADGEVITVLKDWTIPGIASVTGPHRMRSFGSYIDDMMRGEVVAIDDAREDPRTASTAAALETVSARALLNMPLTERGRLVAMIFVNSAQPRAWSVDEVAFVRNVAGRTRAVIERRRAERALRDLAASLEVQVEERTRDRDRLWRMPDLLLAIAGFDARILAVNPAWTTMLGWREDELLGQPYADFIHPEDAARSLNWAARYARGERVEDLENRYRHKDGRYLSIGWTITVGEGVFHCAGRDVTAEKEREAEKERLGAQLRQSQKMEAVGQLTGGIAHDFNNLLTGVIGSLELMGTRIAQGRLKDVDRYVNAAQGAAKRAAALTHRLLAFSRQQTLAPKPTDANRLVAGMEELVRRTVGPAVEVEVVGTAGLWSTLVDPPQLENALLNLCINARDAMPDGGRITIETANKWLDERMARERDLPPGQYVSLCVTDTGTGMPPEVIARVFDPFFTTKPLGQGTGLGLSMIYGFARQSGGQVRVYSEVGQGTTMCLYLPRHYGEGAAEEREASLTDAPRAQQGETVLVVDDEATMRMLVTEVLEDLGYTAIEAADGAAGLKVLRSDVRIDLLVTDVGLPGGMNGRQVADAARAARPDLKVLFITGYAENAVIGNGHLDPGMQVMTKPFAMEALASKIKSMIEGYN